MKHIIAAVLAIASTQAHADEWTGADKQKHFAVHVVSGAAVRTIFPSLTDTEAIAVATIPGVIKELHDARSGGLRLQREGHGVEHRWRIRWREAHRMDADKAARHS